MIVDDNTFNTYTLSLLLENSFNKLCDVAYSGKDALELVRRRIENGERMYDLILTDINMPEMDGMIMSKKVTDMLKSN